jgi:Histidyl-tRNA synthetase
MGTGVFFTSLRSFGQRAVLRSVYHRLLCSVLPSYPLSLASPSHPRTSSWGAVSAASRAVSQADGTIKEKSGGSRHTTVQDEGELAHIDDDTAQGGRRTRANRRERKAARKPLIQRVRGTADSMGVELRQQRWLMDSARAVAGRFGCEEVRTPIMEAAGLFERAVGSDSELVQRKEMYVFEDLSQSRVCLRPEGTAAVARALLQRVGAPQLIAQPRRVYYSGPMFR